MARILSILVGLFFTVALLWSLLVGLFNFELPHSVEHDFHKAPQHLALSSDGPFGKFDRQQLQRGFQVYKEVCAACHGLRHVAFRDLAALGYNEPEVKAIAKGTLVPGIDPATGEATTRPGLPTDYFPEPFANDVAARAANNNAIPPDLSLMTKARHHGPAYVYSLLTGYTDAATYKNAEGKPLPKENYPTETTYFNPYFANLNLAMAPPLNEGMVSYGDGTEASVDQMSRDVAAFLVWTAEPKLEKRNQVGWPVLGFLLFATVLGFLAFRNIWADKKKKG